MSEETTVDVVLQQAEALLEVGRWEEAARRLTDVLAQHPDDVEVLCQLAACYQEGDQPELALRSADQAIGRDPEFAWAYQLRAHALADLGKRRLAMKAAAAAVELAPDSPSTHAVMARSLLEWGSPRALHRARHHAGRALSLAPEDPNSHMLDGLVKVRTMRIPAARRAFERALTLDPEKQEARHVLAELDLALTRVGPAARGFDDAAAMAPADADIAHAHQRGLRAWLWRRFDVMCLIVVAVVVLDAVLGGMSRAAGAVVAGVALLGYGLYAGRSVSTLSRGARLSLRRQLLRRPTFTAAPLCIAVVAGSMVIGTAVQPDFDSVLSTAAFIGLLMAAPLFLYRLTTWVMATPFGLASRLLGAASGGRSGSRQGR